MSQAKIRNLYYNYSRLNGGRHIMAKDEKKEAEDKAKAEKVIKEITTAMSSMKGKNDDIKELKGQVQAAQRFLNLKGTRATQVLGTLEQIQRQIKIAEEDQKQKVENPEEPILEESQKLKRKTVFGAVKSRASTIFGSKGKSTTQNAQQKPTDQELKSSTKPQPEAEQHEKEADDDVVFLSKEEIQQADERKAKSDALVEKQLDEAMSKIFDEEPTEAELAEAETKLGARAEAASEDSDDDVIFLKGDAQDDSLQAQEENEEQAHEAEGQEEVEDIVLDDEEDIGVSVGDDTHGQEAKEGEQEDAQEYIIPGDDYYEKEAATEGAEGQEAESVEEMEAKLAELQAASKRGEAQLQGAGGNEQKGEEESVEKKGVPIAPEKASKSEFEQFREFSEDLKGIPSKFKEDNKQLETAQSNENIIAKTAQLVSTGGHIKDQVRSLRTAIDQIKNTQEYKQAMIEINHDAIKENNPTLPDRKNSTPALNSEQKEAYRAIARLDKLLSRVEAGNFGIITSMLKGQVKNHLNTMNTEPLKGQIEKTINKASAKTEVVPPTTSFKK